jgi:hypothetical protein
MPYEEQKGSWTGNHWVPPNGWRYFSNQELLTVYRDKSIMWVGDSLARRAAATMYGILKEAANSSNVNVPSVAAIDASSVLDVVLTKGEYRSLVQILEQVLTCQDGGGAGDYVNVMKKGLGDLDPFWRPKYLAS